MAKAPLNSAATSARGKSGQRSFRQPDGPTLISSQPATRNRQPSAAQKPQRDRLAQAAAYARKVLADPWQRRVYDALAKKLNRRADKLVAADFLNPPAVEDMDVSDYRKQPGGVVRIIAVDDVEVVSVDVVIRTKTGMTVELGPAVKVHGVWCYMTTTASTSATLTITATAKDRPGHTGSLSVTYP